MTANLNALTTALASLVAAVALFGMVDMARDLASAQVTANLSAPAYGSTMLFPVRF